MPTDQQMREKLAKRVKECEINLEIAEQRAARGDDLRASQHLVPDWRDKLARARAALQAHDAQ